MYDRGVKTYEKGARYFFFFQAEDGIRDLTVTGVQTCALPIYEMLHLTMAIVGKTLFNVDFSSEARELGEALDTVVVTTTRMHYAVMGALRKIGRASCRERV